MTKNRKPRVSDLERRLRGYRLATAEIVYFLPDHPHLLQSYIWQDFDLAPEFPVLRRFLAFWQRRLDGPLHSVRVASSGLFGPGEFRAVDGVFTMQ
ncbi:MAG: usg protein [Alphaproteobacteria bacterium]